MAVLHRRSGSIDFRQEPSWFVEEVAALAIIPSDDLLTAKYIFEARAENQRRLISQEAATSENAGLRV